MDNFFKKKGITRFMRYSRTQKCIFYAGTRCTKALLWKTVQMRKTTVNCYSVHPDFMTNPPSSEVTPHIHSLLKMRTKI